MKDGFSRRAAIAWSRERDLTPQRIWPALREKGGIEALLSCGEEELASLLGSASRARALQSAPGDARHARWAQEIERSGIGLLTPFDEDYPRLLAEIHDPPLLLFTQGSLERLRSPAVAVVGSRNASRYGGEVAATLAAGLSAVGISVVSGLARGVDTAAHEAALEGPGGTIAVLGCGLDVDYPRENARLKREIVRRGVALSEFAPGEEPRPQNFPIRNRIIAGLSAGVVVVEASRRSGSLITARLAADFGRDVFAVPGSVFSENSAGTHELLRDGAILCRGVEDVFSELCPALGAASPPPLAPGPPPADLTAEARRLFETLAVDGEASAEELVSRTELPVAIVLAALIELEAAGVASEADGRYGLARR
jgi:DNA processing protein